VGGGGKVNPIFILVTWDREDAAEIMASNKYGALPLIRNYSDRGEAMEIYRMAVNMHDSAYLYETDESGNIKLILEL
jgi:hypothetical protein